MRRLVRNRADLGPSARKATCVKYANVETRKTICPIAYDTQAARYVTVADLRSWMSSGIQFTVIDAETGDDITRVLLA